MSRILLKSEKKMSRTEIAENLSKIAEGVEKGEISLSSGNDSVELNPSERPEFEIKVEEEGDGREISLELEIEWTPGEEREDIRIE